MNKKIVKKKKILIVEDDHDFLWLLKEGLGKQGFLLFFAQDGEEGLALAQAKDPDIIVLDILLPKMDGISVARKIKEKNIVSQIIFLTNVKDFDYISKAIAAAGQADYMVKSDVGIDEVVSRIKEKLHGV